MVNNTVQLRVKKQYYVAMKVASAPGMQVISPISRFEKKFSENRIRKVDVQTDSKLIF